MNYECELWVPGLPQQKGSKIPFASKSTGRLYVRDQNPAAKAWEDRIRLECRHIKPEVPLETAIAVDVRFYYEMPQTVVRKYKTTMPDLDKLVRCVLDALTGCIYKDDCFVVFLDARKEYCNREHKKPGAHIRVRALDNFHEQRSLF